MKNKGFRLILLLLITLGWIILMRKMTAPLDPGSIIKFEFIGTASNAEQFLSDLKALGHTELMTLSIYLDFISITLRRHALLCQCMSLRETGRGSFPEQIQNFKQYDHHRSCM